MVQPLTVSEHLRESRRGGGRRLLARFERVREG